MATTKCTPARPINGRTGAHGTVRALVSHALVLTQILGLPSLELRLKRTWRKNGSRTVEKAGRHGLEISGAQTKYLALSHGSPCMHILETKPGDSANSEREGC
jgi:hypothetical protein